MDTTLFALKSLYGSKGALQKGESELFPTYVVMTDAQAMAPCVLN